MSSPNRQPTEQVTGSPIPRFAIIIGAMKSGTTSLFHYLVQHPQIAGPRLKEPSFFVDDNRWPDDWDWYENLWEFDPTKHQWALEASTNYTKTPVFADAARRMADSGREFKLIYIMRNPLHRVESHVRHLITVGQLKADQQSDDCVKSGMLKVSSYAAQLDGYRAVFPAESMLLLSFETLRDDPLGVTQRTLRFLGLDDTVTITAGRKSNPSVTRSPLYGRLAQVSLLRRVVKCIPEAIRKPIRSAIAREKKVTFKLSDEKRREILDELRPDLKRLHEEYGFDTSVWHLEG